MPQVFDLDLIENDLRLDSQEPCEVLQWLEESYLDSGTFWRELKNHCDACFSERGVSSLFNSYNFYHDIVMPNRNNAAPAMRWYDSTTGMQEISYQNLESVAAERAKEWIRQGLHPGQTVCIIRPMGSEFVVDLLAGLKTGSVISFLPPQAKGFLQRRLEALEPDFIAADKRYAPLLCDWNDRVFPEEQSRESTQTKSEYTHTYQSGDVVFRCFDPCTATPDVPTEISCDSVYLRALGDGMIGLGLSPGKVYAAPGFHFQETVPGLILSGLLRGSTYLHLLPRDIKAEPQLVIKEPIKAFGVSKTVRDILLKNPVDASNSWETWFRNPVESSDLELWQFFIRKMNLKEVFAFNLKWDSSLGGCSLLSVRRKGMAHMNVFPAPGCEWTLGDMTGGDFNPPGDIGTFCVSPPGFPADKKITSSVILKNRGEWTLIGTNTLSRQGRTFPVHEILETLQGSRGFSSLFFSVVDVPLADPGSEPGIVLLVFTGSRTEIDTATLTSQIHAVIREEMGDEFQPDKIDFIPLHPRFLPDMQMDHDWCRSRYLNGSLFRRSREEIFQCLTQLRGCLMKIKAAERDAASPGELMAQDTLS